MPDEFASWVGFDTLTVRIEYPEVRTSIRARTRAPLPSSIVLSQIPINQDLHKVLFPFSPINHQVLAQKHCGNHPQSIVHPAQLVRTSHSRIDNGIAGLAVFPSLEVAGSLRGALRTFRVDICLSGGFPDDICIFFVEGPAHADTGKVSENVCVEVSPSNLLRPSPRTSCANLHFLDTQEAHRTSHAFPG